MAQWRYIAQRITTGEFLHWELPLDRDELTFQLSGAGSLKGTVAPDVGDLRGPDGRLILEEWGTAIYAEADGELRWGGIVTRSVFEGAKWTVEVDGFSTYPYGIPYLGEWRPVDGGPGMVEPLRAFREIWRHVQSYPDANLGVVLDAPATSTVRLGNAEEPYFLFWADAKDCGSEIDTLSKETPFDYVEEVRWNGDAVRRSVRVGLPRLGTRRDDLAFVQGDNVTNVVSVTRDGEDFANEVVGLGSGEGKAMIFRRIPRRDGRLRRPAVYTDKAVTSAGRMDALIKVELERRAASMEVTEITVVNHPNARIGAWALGDDIRVRAEIPWLGEVEILSRILSWSLVGDDMARLTLARSDSFRYGG